MCSKIIGHSRSFDKHGILLSILPKGHGMLVLNDWLYTNRREVVRIDLSFMLLWKMPPSRLLQTPYEIFIHIAEMSMLKNIIFSLKPKVRGCRNHYKTFPSWFLALRLSPSCVPTWQGVQFKILGLSCDLPIG